MSASAKGDAEIIRALLDESINVNAMNNEGKSLYCQIYPYFDPII